MKAVVWVNYLGTLGYKLPKLCPTEKRPIKYTILITFFQRAEKTC